MIFCGMSISKCLTDIEVIISKARLPSERAYIRVKIFIGFRKAPHLFSLFILTNSYTLNENICSFIMTLT